MIPATPTGRAGTLVEEDSMGLGWFGAPEHTRWLAAETHALLAYA